MLPGGEMFARPLICRLRWCKLLAVKDQGPVSASRRRLLQSAAGLAVARAAMPAGGSLPAVQLGAHRVTRLIMGSNPFNGYCYSLPSLSEHMREWSTPRTIAGVLRQAWSQGINTWQFGYSDRCMEALDLHQAEGGQLQWILLASGPLGDDPATLKKIAQRKPLAIVHHGGVTDRRFRAGQMDRVHDFLKTVRDAGVLAGLSTHQPDVIDWVEQRDWPADFYMTCFYQFGRSADEVRKITGELPLGTVFLEGDPARMCRVIRQTRKTCLAYKILAAGRLAETPQALEKAYRFAFDNIKPQDAVIVGMYPRFKDEVAQNAQLVSKLLAGPVPADVSGS